MNEPRERICGIALPSSLAAGGADTVRYRIANGKASLSAKRKSPGADSPRDGADYRVEFRTGLEVVTFGDSWAPFSARRYASSASSFARRAARRTVPRYRPSAPRPPRDQPPASGHQAVRAQYDGQRHAVTEVRRARRLTVNQRVRPRENYRYCSDLFSDSRRSTPAGPPAADAPATAA